MTSSKRERVREAWRETLQRLADRLPDVDIPPPEEGDIIDEDHHRGASPPPPIPEN